MKSQILLVITILCLGSAVSAADKKIDSGYLGFKSNPVDLTFDSGKKGKTPAGTKVDILIWSLAYSKDYVKTALSNASKEENKTLKQSKEPSACLNKESCKAILKKYDSEGFVVQSYELRSLHGKTVERNSLVKLLDGPFKGRKAWVDDSDLYLRR
jgi:hypothetical protein